MGDPEELKKLLEEVRAKGGADGTKLAKAAPVKEEFLRFALEKLKAEKPNDRSEIDRRYAVCITELEKVIGYYVTWIVLQP